MYMESTSGHPSKIIYPEDPRNIMHSRVSKEYFSLFNGSTNIYLHNKSGSSTIRVQGFKGSREILIPVNRVQERKQNLQGETLEPKMP